MKLQMRLKITKGFTLVEMLIVVTILGIVGTVAIPMLSSNDPQKLSVAAEETANSLRFALSEAKRTGGYVLVDGKTTAGLLKFYYSDDKAKDTGSALNDPLTKRTLVLDVKNNAFSNGVTLTPQFRAGGSPWTRLLIGPGLTQIQAFDNGASGKGLLEANSGVLLTFGSQSTLVSINQTTGLVTLP